MSFSVGDRVEFFGQDQFEKDWGAKGTITRINGSQHGGMNYSVQFDEGSNLKNNSGYYEFFMGVYLRKHEVTYDPNQMVDDEDDL